MTMTYIIKCADVFGEMYFDGVTRQHNDKFTSEIKDAMIFETYEEALEHLPENAEIETITN